MRRVIISAATAVLGILLGASSAFSCTCKNSGPPCQSFGSSPAVFIGTPIQVKRTTRRLSSGNDEYPARLFIFRVDEPFRGVGTAQIEVRTGMDDGDCGYTFNLGERYLVYAGFDAASGLYDTSICSRTRPLSDAGEDLDYIRNLKDREAGATLSGELRRYRHNLETQGILQLGPLANIKISITSESKSLTIRTDEQGRYQLTGLEPGEYVVRPELPDELGTYDPQRKTKLIDRGCSVVSFQVTDNGRISGQIFDADGQPAPKMMLTLMPASQAGSTRPSGTYADADVEGRYQFNFVPPGNYLLGIRLSGLNGPESPETIYPRFYYPGVETSAEATVITIGQGTVLKDVNFRLPPRLVKRVISGKVIFADGSPAAKANVSYSETTYTARGLAYGITADDQGNFSFEGFEGISYSVSAFVNEITRGQRQSKPLAVPPRGLGNNLVLIISDP